MDIQQGENKMIFSVVGNLLV